MSEENTPTEEAQNGIEKFSVSEGKEDGARSLELEFDFGGSSARAVEIFGEEAVYTGFVRGAKVALQGYIRAKLADVELSDDAILEMVAEWKPGTRSARGTSKTSKIEKLLGDMSDEEREAFILKIKEMDEAAEEAEEA